MDGKPLGNFTKINNNQLEILFHVRNSFLIYNQESWIKKTARNFDVSMGCLDGAETC